MPKYVLTNIPTNVCYHSQVFASVLSRRCVNLDEKPFQKLLLESLRGRRIPKTKHIRAKIRASNSRASKRLVCTKI